MGSIEVSCRFVGEAGKDGDLLSDLIEVVNNVVLVLNLVVGTVIRVASPDVDDKIEFDFVTVAEVLLSSVRVATLSRVAIVEFTKGDGTGVVNIFV